MRKLIGYAIAILAVAIMVLGLVWTMAQRDVSVSDLLMALGGSGQLQGIDDRSDVEVDRALKSGLKDARADWKDAKLTSFAVPNVYPDGHSDLTLGEGGTLTMTFASKTHSTAPNRPRGAAGGDAVPCLIYSVMQRRTMRQVRDDLDNCAKMLGDEVPKTPHCTVREVWSRAIERGAPSDEAVASLTYSSRTTRSNPVAEARVSGTWYFEIGDSISMTVADTCDEQTEDVPKADLSAFDPWRYVDHGEILLQRGYRASETKLTDIHLEKIREDGRLALTESEEAYADLSFIGSDATGTCRKWSIYAKENGMRVSAGESIERCEMEKAEEALDGPECSFEQVRERAESKRPDLRWAGATVNWSAPVDESNEGDVFALEEKLREDLENEDGDDGDSERVTGEWWIEPAEGEDLEIADDCEE